MFSVEHLLKYCTYLLKTYSYVYQTYTKVVNCVSNIHMDSILWISEQNFFITAIQSHSQFGSVSYLHRNKTADAHFIGERTSDIITGYCDMF